MDVGAGVRAGHCYGFVTLIWEAGSIRATVIPGILQASRSNTLSIESYLSHIKLKLELQHLQQRVGVQPSGCFFLAEGRRPRRPVCILFHYSFQTPLSVSSSSHRWLRTATLHILTLTCPAFDGSMYSNTRFHPLESSLQAAFFLTLKHGRRDDVPPHCLLYVLGWHPRRPLCKFLGLEFLPACRQSR